MQYQCVQCDERFTLSGDDDKPRCPKCLRQHGLRKLEESPAAGGRSLLLPILLVLGVLGAGAGGFFFWQQHAERATGPLGLSPIASDELRERARILSGVDVAERAEWLSADAAVEAFAEHATQGKNGNAQKAGAIVAAFGARAAKQAFVPWPRTEAREGAPLGARALLQALSKDGGRAQLYPLEVAALAAAGLRSLGVPALIAEIHRYEGERAPLDPSGRFGYYGIALPAVGGAAALVYDPYGGRTQAPRTGDFTVLNDVQALGAYLGLWAMHRLGNASDSQGALADADAAAKLSPSSAAVRGVRAAVLLASGGTDDGIRELEAAGQLRPDGVRHNNLAMLSLAKGDAERALKEISLSLSEFPDYAAAHLTLASVHLARMERDLATAELQKAESLEPQLPALPLAWAELYASAGELPQALAKAEEGVRLRPKAAETHLVLARVQRQAGRYDDMRREAKRVLELAPVADQERTKSLLRALLGPTALEEPSAAAEPSPAPAATDLALSQGQQAARPGAPGAAATDAPPSGALQLGSGTPKLHLGGTGQRLKLDLSH